MLDLYNLGTIPWLDAQLIYHALPRLGREGLVLCAPAEAHLCLGLHQDAAWEVDLEYLQERNLPLFRRETGGGLVLLDHNQIFYQVVIDRRREGVPRRSGDFYRHYLQPVLGALRSFGLSAHYQPAVDLWIGDRKISGNGGGEIEGYGVVVGNILLDFDFTLMARCLNLSGVTFREAVEDSMRRKVTTLERELRRLAGYQEVAERLTLQFAEVLGDLKEREIDDELRAMMESLKPRFLAADWLHQPGRRLPYREVKIAEGTYWREYRHAGPAGTLTAVLELTAGRITTLHITGPGSEALSAWSHQLIGEPLDTLALGQKPPPGFSPAEALAWLSG